jgi:hypothetical protein
VRAGYLEAHRNKANSSLIWMPFLIHASKNRIFTLASFRLGIIAPALLFLPNQAQTEIEHAN